MKITTRDLIKIIPLDAQLQADLLEQFDTLPEDKKLDIGRLLWHTYDALFDLKLEENTQLALQRAKDGKESLDKDFYHRVRQETLKQFETNATSTTEKLDLTEARKAMELIVKEIQASKKN